MSQIVTFIGCGEAAQAFSGSLSRAHVAALRGFDVRADRVARIATLEVTGCEDRATALAKASAVWCLVTADCAATAAEECAPFVPAGALWFDGNSCSPGTKARAAAIIEAAGGRYVDVAIMAPVYPKKASVPLLIAGPHAQEAERVLTSLGMNPRVVGEKIGQASTIKMMRSVMIKGIEALTAECLLGARKAGVDDAVLASLQASDPGFEWAERSAYCLERMAAHGIRRASEMQEVARTLRELGLPDRMASATAEWQSTVGALKVALDADAPVQDGADTLLSRLARD